MNSSPLTSQAAAGRICPVSHISFTPASSADQARGRLGWCSFVVHTTVVITSVQVRRALNGRLYLSFPGELSRAGKFHEVCYPMSSMVRDAIEHQVLAELRMRPCDSVPPT